MGLLQQKDGGGDNDCDSEIPDKENILNSSTNGSGDTNVLYYGIYIPHVTEPESKVYTDRKEALRTLKANKKARFKAFTNKQAAIEFSLNGSEAIVKAECPLLPGSPTVAPPENSNYKGPKSQDLVQFRKAIEKHDFTYVRKCVEENPRYLVSSGDTPQILQEGSRYNALHISARANNANVAKFICETVKSIDFMNRLYGGAKSNLADRGSIMLDLYLNTPDKGSNETPLHFASKLGAIEVVRVLVEYEQCDRQRRNKYGDTPKDLVCSRASGLAADAGIKKDILFALEDHYYVAVLRSPDNAFNPTIPEPFCPTSPPQQFLHEQSTPKKSNEPPMMVSCVAGPMTSSDAATFRKKWKTPPRKLALDSSDAWPIVTDPEKGLERVGRVLANDFNVQWKEYWAFLGEFLDLSSPEGLEKFEKYLQDNTMYSSKQDTPEKAVVSPEPVVSPITDLCNNFKTLVINDPRPKVSPHCLVRSSTVYATRLALSLTRGLLPSIQEIDKYQYFLEGCSKDSRFSQEDLSTAHSRLATLVYTRLCSSKNNCDVINSVLDEKTDNCSKRSFDRLKCVLNFVKEISPGKPMLKSCECPIKTNTDSQNNNRFALPDFSDRNLNFQNYFRNSYDLGDGDSDNDDEVDEFFTPPSSPISFEEQDEEEFLAANDSPETFIEGGSLPSKVDFDVYRSLANIIPDLSPTKYPHIYFWSCCVAKHIKNKRS